MSRFFPLSLSSLRENSLKTNPSDGPSFFIVSFLTWDLAASTLATNLSFVKYYEIVLCTFDNSFIERKKRLFDRFPNVEIRQTRSCRFTNASSRGNCRALAQTGLPGRAWSNPNEIAFMHAVDKFEGIVQCMFALQWISMLARGRAEIAKTFFHRCRIFAVRQALRRFVFPRVFHSAAIFNPWKTNVAFMRNISFAIFFFFLNSFTPANSVSQYCSYERKYQRFRLFLDL